MDNSKDPFEVEKLLCKAREYDEDSLFHKDYLCRDLFNVIMQVYKSEKKLEV